MSQFVGRAVNLLMDASIRQQAMGKIMHFEKCAHIDVDTFDGDLLLMNLTTREVLVLNEAAGVLWAALDLFSKRDELLDLLQEALPNINPEEREASLASVLQSLEAGGFITTRAEP